MNFDLFLFLQSFKNEKIVAPTLDTYLWAFLKGTLSLYLVDTRLLIFLFIYTIETSYSLSQCHSCALMCTYVWRVSVFQGFTSSSLTGIYKLVHTNIYPNCYKVRLSSIYKCIFYLLNMLNAHLIMLGMSVERKFCQNSKSPIFKDLIPIEGYRAV